MKKYMVSFVAVGRWIGARWHVFRRRGAMGIGDDERTWKSRFEAAVEASGSIVYDYDCAARRATFGGTTEAVLQVPVAKMPKNFDAFVELVHPDDRTTFAAAVKATEAAGGTFSMEYRLLRSDGQYVTVQDDGKVIRTGDGHSVHVVGLLKDVTEQRRASTALRDTSQQLSLSLSVGGAAAFTWDILTDEVRLLYDGIASSFGVAKPAPATFAEVLAQIHPADREAFERQVRKAIERPGQPYTNEYRQVDPDGAVRWIRDAGQVEFNADGKPLRLIGLATDITDGKQGEERTRANEERFRLAADAINGIIFDYNFATGHVERSRGLFEVLGYRPDEVEPSVAWWGEQMHPDDRERVTKVLLLAAEGEPTQIEYRVRHHDGRWLHVESRSVLVKDGDGRPVRMVGCTVDVTARQQVDAELRRRESFISGVLGSITDGFYSVSADWQFTFANDEMVRRFERPREEIVGKHVWAMFPEAVGNEAYVSLHRAMVDRVTVGYEFFYAPWQRWFLDNAYPTADGGLAVFTRDITERKQSDETLRASEAQFRAVFESAAVGIGRVGFNDARWIDANNELCRILGYTREELRATPWPDITHPNDVARDLIPFQRMAAGDLDSYTVEKRFIHKNGRQVWARLSLSLVRNAAGRPDYEIAIVEDITIRRQAEDRLQASEERLRLGVEIAKLGVVVIDYVADTCTPDARAAALFRLEPEVPVSRSTVHARFHPDDRDEILDRIQQSLDPTGDGVLNMDHRVVLPDGSTRWLSIRKQIVFGEAEGVRRPVSAMLAAVDVTARRETEVERQLAEAQYRHIVEGNPALICRMRPDGRLTFVNDTYCRTFNRSRESLIGHRFTPLIPEEDRPVVARLMEHLAPDMSPYTLEHRVLLPDGQTRWQRWTNKPVADTVGEGTEYLGIGFDITDRKRAEERSRLLSEAAVTLLATDEPNAMLQRLFAKIAPAFGLDVYFNYMADPDGQALLLASAIGISEDQRHAFARMDFGQAVCGTVASTRTPYHARYIQQSDDPKEAVVKSMGLRAYICHPLESGGELLGTLGFGSRSKDGFAPDESAFLYTICNYVTSAYERLRLLNQLRQTDRRKDEFLATLAHELRNPLAPLRSGLQVMKLAGGDAGLVEKSRAMMERQVGQMTHLIDDLMDVSRISQGKFLLQKTRMKLVEAVQDAVDTSRPLIDARGHTLVVEVPPEPLYVDADRTRLAQVFGNLLNNAAKYTQPGGRIRLVIEQHGSHAVVIVEDNGIGIPTPMLSNVFDMFAQVDRSLEKSQGGLGIGLNIVKRLVEMHDGSIVASSGGHNKGSRFIVQLPVVLSVVASDKSDDSRASVDKAKPVARRRILVVDDNQDGAISLAEMLDIMGSDTQTAFDGAEAVSIAQAFKPDVILMDIGMPKLNGYEACRRIRSQPWGRSIVIVAQTGWGQEDDKRKSNEAGFDFHMVKPIDPETLEAMLAGKPRNRNV